MRKYILLFIALCLHIAVRGQTIVSLEDIDLSGLPQPTQAKALRYWFDDDASSVQTLEGLTGQYALDVSSLIEGLHTLHYHVIDTEDHAAYVRSGLFLKVGQHSESLSVKSMRYWFDDDASSVQTADGTTGTYLLDVSPLIEGLHTLHYQLTDESDVTAYVGSAIFLKVDSKENDTAPKSLRYWFDDEEVSTESILSGGVRTIDVSALLDGLHTIHYQVVGNDSQVYYVASGFFMKIGTSTGAETLTASKLMYWFDDDTTMQLMDVGEGVQMLDASELMEGLHTLHYQVLCSNGQMTPAMSSLFLRISIDAGTTVAKSLRYWYDDEQTATDVEITEGVQMLDASRLIEGLHTVHYQIANSNGTLGAPYSSIFLLMNWDNATTTAKSLRYWFDDETTVTETAVANGTQALDASRLIEGLHTVHYQIVDSNGTLGAPVSSVFLKMDYDNATATAKSIRYWFDDDATTVKVTNVANGSQTLDVSDLQTGLHTLNYQLIDSNGRVGVPVTGIFLKNFDKVLADGHNRVTKYQYWLNTNSQAMQTVTLDAAANPYTLIALLPIQKEPIQSSQFHFEVTNDVPTIYAKNTLHVRFYDAQNYFTDGQKQFVDYSVSQEVEPVGELQATQTFDKVAGNDIRWYTMQAAPGDTAAFRVSQAATVQVFAPSGKEVFNTSESASVKWGGIHTWEDGTYYVAVHDVTGSRNTMTLDYMHMDKYDVVDWDVHRVGNGGCSTITFKGNGFRDLYAVDLFTEEGDTIHSENINYISDATASVRFNFTDVSLGVYDAIFRFTEGEKNLNVCVTVEEPEEIILVEDVIFASTFLRGTSNTYTIKIENKGNSTAYQVPLMIQLQADGGLNDITYIKLSDNLSSPEFDWLNDEGISDKDKEELKVLIASKGNFLDFFMIRDSIENEEFMEGYFAINLPPKSTTNFTITVKSNSRVNIYTLLPDDWDFFAYENQPSKLPNRIKKKSAKEGLCCARQHVECAMNLVATVLDYGSVMGGGWAVASCIASIGNTIIPFAYDIWCGETPKDKDEAMKSLYKNIASSLISCVGKLDPYKMGWMIQHVNDVITTSISCFSHPKRIPNCPPKPPIPHPSNPQPPSDPNDIYGYLSEAGSKFIADSVARVNYTIEFENDTTFATAAAHTIVIKDTLDSRYFDLTKFMPTGVRIGGHEVFLDEADVVNKNDKTSFVKTIDMRPEINVIAQAEGTFNSQTGIAQWTFQSLDPMTMEPTDDLIQGILPVNYNGTSGIGEVIFEIGVKQGKDDGAEINNRAGIVFDYEEAILTPTWTNIVDAIAPNSCIDEVVHENDSTLGFRFHGEDNASGIWKYRFYVQAGENAPWWEEATDIAPDSTFCYHIYEGIDYGFCVLAVDMAGNVEKKELRREYSSDWNTVRRGDVNGDGEVDLSDAIMVTYYSLHVVPASFNEAAADMNGDGQIDLSDAIIIIYKSLGVK